MDNGFFFSSGDCSPSVHSDPAALSGHSQAFHFDVSGDRFFLGELIENLSSGGISGEIFAGSGAGIYNLRPNTISEKSGPLVPAQFNPKPQLGQNQNQNQTGLGNSQESTVSQQNPVPIPNEPKSRKRKLNESATTQYAKAVRAEESLSPKKCKKPENGNGCLKPPEPTRDYIHVRARRGQATDSHSLAERVRREKISERMKFLQDLVPGCNKVTGKALMLDEIINYVQSLQQQVEFLSMKLASINTSSSFVDSSNSGFFAQSREVHGNVADGTVTHSLFDGFGEVASQDPTLCGDDLQSLVQMGFCRKAASVSHNVRGSN